MWRNVSYWSGIALVAAAPLLPRAGASGEPPGRADSAAPIRRIASLSPSTTELCAALGLTDRLVARSRFCDWPPEVLAVPDVGGLLDPDLERIVLLRPDLVLLPGASRLLRDAMAATDLRAVALPDSSLEDVFSSLSELGRLTGRAEHTARIVDEIRRDLEALRRSAHPATRRRVLLVIESQPPIQHAFVAGPRSYLDTLLSMSGHLNAMAALNRPWAEVSAEQIVAADPDAIIEFRPAASAADAPDVVRAWAPFDSLRAVRDRRVFVVRGRHHVVPGPRVAETLRLLMELLNR